MAILKARNEEVEGSLREQNELMAKIKSDEDQKNKKLMKLAQLEESQMSDIGLLRDHLCSCKIQLNQHAVTHKELSSLVGRLESNNTRRPASCLSRMRSGSQAPPSARQIERSTLLNEMTRLLERAARTSESHPLDYLKSM